MAQFDKPRENCGVVGVFSPSGEAVSKALLALISLQHRGQEGAGMVASNGTQLKLHKGLGLISSIFTSSVIPTLGQGIFALSHTRYSTAGTLDAVQPFINDGLALAHNGNLTNMNDLAEDLDLDGEILSDTWLALEYICRQEGAQWEEKFRQSIPKLRGAFSFVGLSKDKLYVIRDPWGFRPLVLGRLVDGGWIVASETSALHAVDATFVREVMPSEGLVIDKNGLSTFYFDHRGPLSRCIFEYIYIARPDSRIFGQEVHAIRKRCGKKLFEEAPVDADVVISIPHSGDSAARGYSEASGIPIEEGVFANRYVGRAFIEPLNRRKQTTHLKYGVISSDIVGKRICAIDDSIVRGDASSSFVRLLKEHGAKEVHIRVASPPLKFPCFYGVDFATKEELIANRHTSIPCIKDEIGADSLAYLSYEGLVQAVTNVAVKLNGQAENIFGSAGFCGACFTGKYPVPIETTIPKEDKLQILENYTILPPASL